MDIKKAKLLLSKITSNILNNQIFKEELKEDIHSLMSLGEEAFIFNFTEKETFNSSFEKNYVALPIILLSLIKRSDEQSYNNQDFVDFLSQYKVEHLLGNVLAANQSNLLGTCISYNNFELFNYFFTNYSNQFDINYQNNKGDTILHLCSNLIDNDAKAFIQRIFKHENLNLEILNKEYKTAYDSFNDNKKNYLIKLKNTKEKDYFDNIIVIQDVMHKNTKI